MISEEFVFWGPDGVQLYRSARSALPPRAVLGERLQQATERARLQIEQRKTDNE